jgi:Flp pilus assembly protein TadD
MKGRYVEAIDDLSKAMAIAPGFSWTYFHRGISYLQLGRQGQAIVDMQEAARMGNREAQSWLKERREKVDFLRSHKGG